MPNIVIITGPPGSGKSTMTKSLARLNKGRAINVDKIRHSHPNYVDPWVKSKEAKEQIKLAIIKACNLAKNFISQGFNVYIDDVLSNKYIIQQYRNILGKNIKIILLLPPKNILLERLQKREKGEKVLNERAKKLHSVFSKIINEFDEVIDNSDLSKNETLR